MFSLTPVETEVLSLSLRVALAAVAGCLPVGLLTAWVLARYEFPGKSLINAFVHLPLVVPPVVVGYVLLVMFGRRGIIGAWLWENLGISIAFTWKGAAVAAAVMAFPLMVRAIQLSIESVDRRLEMAAWTLGAPRWWCLLTVTFPLILPGVLTGIVLAFARSLGEFGATITFVSNIPGETQTLPLALFSLTQTPGGDAGAFRLVVLSVVLAFGALIASEALARRVDRRISR